MFNFFKRTTQVNGEVANFIVSEKKRRAEAEEFLQYAAICITQVADTMWGDQKTLSIGKSVMFDTMKEEFFVLDFNVGGGDKQINISDQKGRPYWESIREVMEFTATLVEDIRNRHEGRNNLVTDMRELKRQVASIPFAGFVMKSRHISL